MISGFTIVRNARRLDYPFRESVRSVLPLCDELVIGCGQSDDDTRELCRELERESPKVRVFESNWERDRQSGGFQLKHQSDLALDTCRGEWCLYIQADEAMHEADFPLIREAMARADRRIDVDGILFDYLHFYGNYSYYITGRNWYRREVRLIKNHRGIRSYRDAQGFRREGKKLKVIPSGARVFHYGYVRTAASLGVKTQEMSQWWGEEPMLTAERLQLRRHVGLRPFRHSHPAAMADRIRNESPPFDPHRCPRVWDKREIKNAITLAWESIFRFRIGEFRNYELV